MQSVPVPPVDCERIVDGLLGQPVNTVTSLAFLVAAVVVAMRTRRRWVAAALVATGIGSVLSHGPMPPGANWAHDVGLTWLLLVVGAFETRFERWSTWPTLLVIGAARALVPAAGPALGVIAAVVALPAVLWRDRRPRTLAALAVLGVGAVIGRLWVTVPGWCDPDSLVQGHGVWHLAAATAAVIWATQARVNEPATADLVG